ncbi:MAG: SDR family NAD(P)-dependent oxidoreductase [Acetobacteraceae bacterium]
MLDLLRRGEDEAAPSREALLSRAPSLRDPLALLDLCVAALPDVLTGEREGTDVLFPGGSMRLVESIYRDQPVLADCNRMLAASVAAARPARVLEVGAGTGATADAVLDALSGQAGVEYHYTDISPGFVRHARARHSDPRLCFAVLDIEKDPVTQGFEAGGFDVVIATNVLHATRNIRETLTHIGALLRPGGLVLINEMTVAEDFATLTFGLLDGWWRAVDGERRLPHSPLLNVARWRSCLRSSGFAHVVAQPAPGFTDVTASPQVVLLAGKLADAAAQPVPLARPHAVAAAVEPAKASADGIEALVRARVAAGLDLTPDAIDPETPFGEMGVDSIVAPQIAEDINREAGISLRSTDLYNFATVRALAGHIAEAFPEARVGVPAAPMETRREPSRSDAVAEAPVADPTLPEARGAGPAAPAGTSALVLAPHAATPIQPRPEDNAMRDAIAIVGMAGRFPDAPDVHAFWDNIATGKSAVREIDRFDLAPYYAPERGKPGTTYARWAATIDDYDRFDPLFFSISPAEAEAMDPQQRLLLEEAWHALEDAGAIPAHLDGLRCGVFVGASANSYAAPAAPSLQTLGGSMAILSARLSYFLNLKGPTFPVDTGCSSSLVALHLACQSLRLGESDMALAAGVSCNLLSPPIFLYLADAGMASPNGRCATFDDAADGFAPGEGVGVVVLKRLADALRDGDRIHAVVLGTGINQDGKTSGLTAPSATSQTELEIQVYRQAGITPRSIGLIEAHGTGTRLGDPIEIAALTDAFAAFTRDTGFCAIGSVKTNIGHAMAAAGVAGLIKAVQALRHRALPPSLHFSTPNRHIDFAGSPFVVNTAARAWESDAPRRAAISSFGFSGTNAHVLLQEAPPGRPALPAAGPFLFVLSARTEAALGRRVEALRRWLREHADAEPGDVAYTLGARRAHFRHRLAFVAGSLAELALLLAGGSAATADAAGPVDLARRYMAGETLDFGFMTGHLVDLPLYPFERERYWNPVDAAAAPAAAPIVMARVGGPSATYPAGMGKVVDGGPAPAMTGETAAVGIQRAPVPGWLTRDHVINGRCLLPGAAFLELARAAALGGDAACTIRDIVWSVPLDATDGDPGMTVSTETQGNATRCVLRSDAGEHAECVVRRGATALATTLDTAAIAARFPTALTGSGVYETATRAGFAYGPGFRVIEDVRIGDGEAFARLVPPAGVDGDWGLHPGLLDGVLQTAACVGLGREQGTHVPFALAAFQASAPLRGPCLVHARLTRSAPGLMVFDIDVAGPDGAVLTSMRGLQARALATSPEINTLLYTPVWRPAPAAGAQPDSGTVLACASDGQFARLCDALPGRRLVQVTAGASFQRLGADRFSIDPASPDDYRRLLADAKAGAGACLALLWDCDGEAEAAPASLASSVAAMDPDTGLRALFLAARAALAMPEAGIVRIVHAAASAPAQEAAAGFARSVALESSRLSCVSVATGGADLTPLLTALRHTPDGAASVTCRDGTTLTRVLEPWTAASGPQAAPLSPGQACLITGGAGAIGLAVARHLARTCQPRLVLVGRSPLTPAIEQALADIEAEGADALYLGADVTSGASLRAALDKARRRFGPLHGVIHAAGVLRDARIAALDPAGFDAVVAPKLLGAVTLDHLTRDDPLAFFALFSSTAAAFGSAGQAAYAAANGFLDGFAAWRAGQNRPGRSVSIAWPLWRNGGMAPPPDVAAELERRMGMLPLPDDAAMAVLDHALTSGPERLVVLHGRTDALRRFAGGTAAAPVTAPAAGPALPKEAELRDQVEAYLKSVLARETKLAEARIDSDERFEAYGIDSMMIVRMNTQIEQDLGDLPKTLFFEYQTVHDLATCLLQSHRDALARRFAKPVPATQSVQTLVMTAPVAPSRPHPETAADDGAIAIIGVSGLYPMANDLDQFWRNLAGGRDCIIEIPPERWPLDGFYDPDRDRPETSYSKWGGFIDGVDMFDARFFNISPREADALDPQARKFLEVAWATMEDAGLTRETLFRGDAEPGQRLGGVFVGVMYGDYQLFGAEESVFGNLIAPNAAYWNVANRVSHFLDLHGPSMAVDTACSSSLTAVHMACAALRNGDCSVAFVGGVNLTLHPSKHWILSKSGFASSDGRCRSFGAGGDGYVPGEGVGAVLLKPLARAIADGNRIHAVIRSSAVNHGGRTSGYTVPNPVAQGSLIAAALRRGGVAPETISYVEAHGTGTALGDPVEIAGLARAFTGMASGACPIGSVKSNIGHLESAAGIAALTKVVLQLRHDALAPSLHADALNPNLTLETTPFVVQRALAPWPRPAGAVRRAGISSFGAGGANAHVVVEDAPVLPADAAVAAEPLIVPLSAATAEALREQASRLADWLGEHGGSVDFAAVARTLQAGREAMRHRWAVRVSSAADLADRLRAFVAGQGEADAPEVAAWLEGGRMDWDAVAPGPRRPVSLPTYPFARRRCWVTLTPRGAAGAPIAAGQGAAPEATGAGPGAAALPLRSDPADPLVADHRLGGRAVLAGAFLLDAVRDAAVRVLRGPVSGVADISFRRPVTPDMPARIAIAPDGSFAVDVGDVPHVTGRLLTGTDAAAPSDIDLASVASRCESPVAQPQIYAALAAGGAEYGPAYRLLDTVWRGDGEAFAELAPVAGDGWSPGVLDAAFQMSFALATGAGGMAPFTIERLVVTGPPTEATHAVGFRRDAGPGFLQLDLRLTDAAGKVLVAIDGFVARAVPAAASTPAPEPASGSPPPGGAALAPPAEPLRLLRPLWVPEAALSSGPPAGDGAIISDAADHGLAEGLRAAWTGGAASVLRQDQACPPVDHVWYLGAWRPARDEAGAVAALAALLRDLAARPRPPALTVVVQQANAIRDDDTPNPAAAAVAAFAKAAGREHPDLRIRVIDTDAETRAADLLRSPAGAPEIAWRGGTAWTRRLGDISLPPVTRPPWREGGVYLIAGGAGGIGLALAEYLIRTARARIVLLGRRPADEALRARLARIGGDVLHLAADGTDAEAGADAVGVATARFGAIHGAFHLALVMHDARAVTLADADIRAVMAPKTGGTRNLIAALADQPLDCLMLFSSSNAFTTNPGQSAYAAASAAQDAIGLGAAPWPVKVIDWGFWGEVGRVATDAYRASLARIGVFPISTDEGMDIVARMAAAAARQIVPLRISDDVASALGVTGGSAMNAIADAVAPRARAAEPMLARATGSFAAIDAYAASLLLLAWQELGAMRTPGERLDADTPARVGVQPRFRRLVAAQFDMLVRAGFLHPDGSAFLVDDTAGEPAAARRARLAAQRAEWLADRLDVAPYLDLLDTCAGRLPDILLGRVDANDVLFPGGSPALVEPIYRGNPVVDHFQAVVAEAVAAAAAARPGAEIRILEIGAGTGGTTAFVLPALAPHADRVRYVFTDIGRFFLDAARRRFAEYPFLTMEVLDIEAAPSAQGFDPNGFDIVIAANVLHATRDIRTTLGNVRSLLRRGGVLLLNEATMRQDFNTMTFGLTRGWWAFEDTDRRLPHAPLLPAGAWLSELATQGFHGTRVLAGGDGALQTVIAAEGDGKAPVPVRAIATHSVAPAAGAGQIEEILRQTVAKSLRLRPEEVEPETSFAEFGADSIISVDLVREINAALGIELKTTALFNYATIRALGAYIQTEFADRLGVAPREATAGTSRARERSERLREIIRKRRQGMAQEPVMADVRPDTPPLQPEPPPDPDAEMLRVLQRLRAGEIGVTEALAEAGDD